jgi:exodeoxyribonuclease-5
MRRDLPYFTTLPALTRLARRLAEHEAPLCPQTTDALEAFAETAAAASRKLPPGQWAGVFQRCLKAAGWTHKSMT